jgi:hypothetical protein
MKRQPFLVSLSSPYVAFHTRLFTAIHCQMPPRIILQEMLRDKPFNMTNTGGYLFIHLPPCMVLLMGIVVRGAMSQHWKSD